jgi:hypothetical protein
MVVLLMGVAGASFWVIQTRSEVAQLNETVSVRENRIDNLAQQVNIAIQAGAVPLSPSADPPPVASINRSEYTVWIQFAGSLRREQMIDLGRQLAANWTVPGANRGGERIEAAAGLNEIRFGPSSDEAAARLLAVEVAQTSIVSGRRSIRRVPSIRPKSLELWISRRHLLTHGRIARRAGPMAKKPASEPRVNGLKELPIQSLRMLTDFESRPGKRCPSGLEGIPINACF